MPGDTITCTLALTTTRKVTIATADLHLPASTLYVSGTGSPESLTPRFDGTKAHFTIPNLDIGGPRTVAMKIKVKKDAPDETALISKAEYRDGPSLATGAITKHSNQLVTSTVPAKPGPAPGGTPGQPYPPQEQPAHKGQLTAVEGVSFVIAPGDTQDFGAGSLATRTSSKPKDLRFRGDCTGQKNGTVAVRDHGRTAVYQNNGAKGEETLTCEIVEREARNAGRVQSRVTIKVE